MASAAVCNFLLPHPATLCPPPLEIQKRPRRTTIRRRMLRKSTHSQIQSVKGPLDDIIDEIRSDIWDLPSGYSANPSFINWANPLKAPSTWIVTPLPVSRAPNDQPLTIRKNRNSRSSTSSSSMGDPMPHSRNSSQDESADCSVGGVLPSSDPALRPLNETAPSNHYPSTAIRTEHTTAQQTLEEIIESRPDAGRPQRTSSLRLFTNRFPRLRRTRTGETGISTGDASEYISPTGTSSLISPDEASELFGMNEPTDEAVEAYMKRNAHNCTRLRAIMERMAKRLPAPVDDEHDVLENNATKSDAMPTTLRAAIRMFPQAKILTEKHQEIDVAVEIEGVLHNRSTISNVTVDIIFVIDNGYDLFRDLTANICRCGTQVWEPARPNPSMTDVVLAVAKSLDNQDLKHGRTHLILLSPAAYVLHDVSKTFPDLYIHRINPAALPYRREPELQDTVCFEDCCKNVFVSNWTSYQSVPGRVKRILKNARSDKSVGELTNISVDVRTREGCELIEFSGEKTVSHLRLGQVHTFFVRIRVDRKKAQAVDLDSVNPVFNSSLDVKGLRQELQNAVAVGAVKAHIFDVQLYLQNSINTVDCWNYTEAPLTLIRELGGLALPVDSASELVKRQYFHKFVQLTTSEARVAADQLLAALDINNELARKILERLTKEIKCHKAIRQYERTHRQKLPLCPGPIDIEASHEWLEELWNKKKNKRNGIAGVGAGTPGLIDGFSGLTHNA
ncbi:hypothetical protein CC86DRAFT_343633 [Ophiobolus disseminans]|uniref:Uncharacterized protein n=1 Tax=Ophiobolus disseminans TaxID=1469910 RepID=A0A6A7AC18_9PLEO|nr:hypothetical protein CC86DRAFT_343633 [Ophiobolus disseminans]